MRDSFRNQLSHVYQGIYVEGRKVPDEENLILVQLDRNEPESTKLKCLLLMVAPRGIFIRFSLALRSGLMVGGFVVKRTSSWPEAWILLTKWQHWNNLIEMVTSKSVKVSTRNKHPIKQ